MDRIYTQADYDKVTDLYNEYQTKKDSYTPEQQQRIEAAFWNAWAATSNKIEEWNNRLVDMWNDEQWNSWWRYWDWRVELLNAAPQPAVKRTPRQTYEPIPYPWNTYWSPYNPNWTLNWGRDALAWAWTVAPMPTQPEIPNIRR